MKTVEDSLSPWRAALERGPTRTELLEPNLHTLLCALVRASLSSLHWRHSGLGMLQAYLKEGHADELRVHIWHDSLRSDGILEAGFAHDHRFDMTSWVLVGTIEHTELALTEHREGEWQRFQVVNARRAEAQTGSMAGRFIATGNPVRLRSRQLEISAGRRYTFPKGAFHQSLPVRGLAVSVIEKSNQEDRPATVLSRRGVPPVNAFDSPIQPSSFDRILKEADQALGKV
jgi:hypothetical protein